jgi:hypothetical protein
VESNQGDWLMKFRRNAVRAFGFAVIAASCASFGASSAVGQNALPNTVVAGGGGTVSAGQFRVHSTIGEPAAGTVSSGNLTLNSGFQATFVGQEAGPDDGHIFYDGFEGND